MAEYSAGTASIQIRPNLKDFKKRAEAELAQIKISYGIDIEPEMEKFRAELDAELSKLQSSVDVDVDADTAAAATKIEALTKERRAEIRAEADTLKAQTQLDSAASKRRTASINAEADVLAAETKLQVTENKRRIAEINADADTMAAEAKLMAAARRRKAEIDLQLDASSVATAQAGIAAVGTSAQMASGSVAMLGAQAAGIGILGVAAMGVVGPLAALASTAMTAAGALLILPSAAGAAAAGIATLGIGLSGIGKAFGSMGQAAGGAGADTSKAMKAAQRGVEDAERGIVQAQRRVADAERSVADAQKASKKTQEDLNKARKDAVEDLRDMNQQLRDAAMDEEEATLAVARARQNLMETKADPKASGLDHAEADLAYRKAVKNLEDTREKNNELARDVDEANRAGVEGSEKVVAAKEKVEQAARREEDAQRSLADAHESVALAQERLADAMENLATAGGGAAGGVDKFADAMANLSPNARAFVLAMQELGDEWKDLRLTVQDNLFKGLGDSVTQLAHVQLPVLKTGLSGIATEINGGVRQSLEALGSDSTVEGMGSMLENSRLGFAGLNQAATPITQALVDIGAAGSSYLPQLGSYLGEAGEKFGSFLTQSTQNGQFDQWIQNGMSALESLGQTASSIGGIFSGVFGAASASGQGAIGPLNQVLEMVNGFVNSFEGQQALQSFFGSMTDALSALSPILGTALQSIGSTIMPAISQFIQSAAPGTQSLIQGLADGLSALAPAMGPLGEAFGAILGAVAPLLEPLGALLTAVIQPIAQHITTIYTAIQPVVQLLAGQLMQVVQMLTPILGQIVGTLTDLMMQIITGLAPYLPMIVQAVMQVLEAVLPLVPILLDLVVNIITPLLPAVMALVPAVVSVVQVLANVVTAVMPVIQILAQLIGIVAQVLASVVGFVATVIAQFISLAAGVLVSVTNLMSSITSGFSNMIASVISAALQFQSDLIQRFNELWANASQSFSEGIGHVLRITGEIKDKILKVFDGAGDWLKNIGSSIMSGLLGGLKDKWNDVKEFFSNSVGSLRSPFSRRSEGSYEANALGSIKYFAGGGENHEPQFAPAGSYRVFGEEETGGELYIPLADDYRRGRAEALLAAGARYFGLEVIDPETGMPFAPGYQGDLGPKSATFFAEGGATIQEIDDFAMGVDGQPYVLGGPFWGDCSQTVSIVTRYAKFGEKLMQRAFSTVNEGQVLIDDWGFYPGLGDPGDLQVGWWDQGGGVNGHTAMTTPSGVAVEMGGYPSQGHFGGSGVGADDSQFTNHAHLPRDFFEEFVVPDMGDLGDMPGLTDPRTKASAQPLQDFRASDAADPMSYGTTETGPTSLSGIAGEFAKNFISGQVKGALDVFGISDEIPAVKAYKMWEKTQAELGRGGSRTSAVKDIATAKSGAGDALALDPTLPTKTVTGAQIVGFGEGFDDITAPAGDANIGHVWDPTQGAEQWRGMMAAAMDNQGYGGNPAELDAWVRQIQSESSGNPGIAQQIVDVNGTGEAAGVGLGQMIPTTWAAYRDPTLPDDRRDPWAMTNAMVRYGHQKYGDGLLDVIGHGHGYWAGGSVWGAGGPTDDAIPALLSNGEFVVREAAARYARPMLERINSQPGLARQIMQGSPVTAQAAGAGTSAEYHVHIQTNNLDEGMRRAEMYGRQRVGAIVGANR
ncbi:hypothetical protein CKALI_11265 [Corynebacterium kalinowskii]|uniref:Tape measure protein n=1 Tax=Corynebacterium kalinowskii TaxID=2675216 RepID=A0A6B8VTZ3_9CORY|nr:hypothetical protein [Corynebacterium kalinowskii]QGU03097.1 hypothetical protein CKALI_11265 [Corynebacterium kalinowskii]